ncbi:MAG: VWA domain-containing protein [Eubacterium sp.]|nr:VWA domain-containing protein [Eubacterium sp.]
MNLLKKIVNYVTKAKQNSEFWKRTVFSLAAVVVFVTTYVMILPAITLDKDHSAPGKGIYLEDEEITVSEDGEAVYHAASADNRYEVSVKYADGTSAEDSSDFRIREVRSDDSVFRAYRKELTSRLDGKDGKKIISMKMFDLVAADDQGEESSFKGKAEITVTYNQAAKIGEDCEIRAFTGDFPSEAVWIKARTDRDKNSVRSVTYEIDKKGLNGIMIIGSIDGTSDDEAAAADDVTAADDKDLDEIAAEGQTVPSEETTTEGVSEETSEKTEGKDAKADSDKEAAKGTEGTLTASGSDYTVTLSYGEDSGLPAEGASLKVSELDQKSKAYKSYMEKAKNSFGKDKEITHAKLYDISIMVDGEEVEPKAPVHVEIQAKEMPSEKEGDISMVHFPDKGKAEILDDKDVELKKKKDTVKGVEFEADQFSVYGIVYTVDFHYTVNGKTYDYSIPGGGFISIETLLEKLGAAENAQEAKELVAEISDISFSNPDLVWVGKVENDTTVGDLKEAQGLDCQYSADLTEEEIEEINAQTVKAVDWIVISLKPFTSEETLTITMKNGDQFTVLVTDGQRVTDYSEIVRGREYIIYVVRDGNQYFALRNDGASVQFNYSDIDNLGPEFIWNFDYDETACWWHNAANNNYIAPEWSNVVNGNPDGRYLWVDQRQDGSGFDIHGNYWSQNYLSWDQSNGFKINHSNDVPINIYIKDKQQLDFTINVNNENYGSVSCSNTVTDTNWKNAVDIVATPAEGCYFVGWRLDDEAVEGFGPTIQAGTFEFKKDNQTLTAVFGKEYTSPATQEINEWVDSLLGNPLESDKTAHVYDYDNRIYEIDLSASSSRYTIDEDIRIEFITDISRSMYFPETLLNEQDFRVNGQINLGQWLLDHGDPEKVYYVIGDINNTATMYAVYSSGNQYFTRWSIVDASYYLPYDGASTSGRIKTVCQISNNGTVTINMTDRFDGNANRIFTGKIYESTPKPPKDTADWDRLSYLTAAVNAVSRAIYRLDPGAQIGLVTFASSASGGTLYGADDEESLINALHSIQPTGGTNQTSAFNLINNSNPPIFTTNSGKRQVALLITDGAPQGTTWEAIERAAEITEGKDVEIWTLGLALDRVGNNKQRLMDLASAGGYSGNAEDSEQLVTETKKILEEMLVKATTIGEVYDTVDPAFYPVDSSGNPIEAGYYYADTAGGNVTRHAAAPSDAKKAYYQWVNDNGTWTITYYNQEIKWPEQGGWSNSFYIKAKEDFMGGNTISTNAGFDNRVEVNRVKHSGSPDGYYWLNQDHSSFRSDFKMPYVNVDELSLTENSTEWRVYLGTEVDPATELKELWNKIQVNLVVKDNGEDDEVITITNGNQMYYSDGLLNDAAAPDGTANETLPLSHFVNADIIDGLIQTLNNGETTATANRSYRYFPYGHEIVGTFDIELTKELTNDEAAADGAPNIHETKEKGEEREVYTLKVTYKPTNEDASETYEKTTPGKSAGKIADGYDADTGNLIQSQNNHKIHVFAKNLEIRKKDMISDSLIDTAKFKLYRTAKQVTDPDTGAVTYEDGAEDLEVGNETKKVVQVGDEMSTSGGIITVEDLSYAPDGTYYLLETKAPDGYLIGENPITIRLTLNDEYRDYKDPYPTITDISNTPYNWEQTVDRLGYSDSEDGTGDDEKFEVIAYNSPGAELPASGGPGAGTLYSLGILFVGLAAMGLTMRRRTGSN